jgi:hypothetical protein
MRRAFYSLTFSDGFVNETHEVPREAIRPLFAYMRKHARFPFIVSGGIFLRHWAMGVNLSA